MTDDFLADLQANENKPRTCPACALISATEPGPLREALRDTLGGTIGRDTLTQIMRRNGHPEVTRHWIDRHRREAHETP